jgi:hypothetical protein
MQYRYAELLKRRSQDCKIESFYATLGSSFIGKAHNQSFALIWVRPWPPISWPGQENKAFKLLVSATGKTA